MKTVRYLLCSAVNSHFQTDRDKHVLRSGFQCSSSSLRRNTPVCCRQVQSVRLSIPRRPRTCSPAVPTRSLFYLQYLPSSPCHSQAFVIVMSFVCLRVILLNVPATCYSVSQGRICSGNLTCCHTEIEAAEQNFPPLPVTVY